MAYCGMFGWLRKSRVTGEMTLTDLINHAQSADNRSRFVFNQLGWLNRDGSVTDQAPEAIKNLDNSIESMFTESTYLLA